MKNLIEILIAVIAVVVVILLFGVVAAVWGVKTVLSMTSEIVGGIGGLIQGIIGVSLTFAVALFSSIIVLVYTFDLRLTAITFFGVLILAIVYKIKK